jgi:hypothetical protein
MTQPDRRRQSRRRAATLGESFQDIMRPYLRLTVERMTGSKVRVFMSANHVDPDLAAEPLILDHPVPAAHGEQGSD